MAEQQVAFLYDAAKSLRAASGSPLQLLKSHYLMRCKAIGNSGKSLPEQHFGPVMRCSHCCLEWRSGGYSAKVLPLRKLKRSARRRLRRSEKKNSNKKEVLNKSNDMLRSNTLVRICKFCQNKTKIKTLKPSLNVKNMENKHEEKIPKTQNRTEKPISKTIKPLNTTKTTVPKNNANVYQDSKSVFTSTFNKAVQEVKSKPDTKTLRKSKKVKYAGLCEEAVLSVAKGKQLPPMSVDVNNTESKLNLFLKHCS